MSLLLDIIILVIFILFVVNGVKKGFIKSILGMGVTIVAIIIAMNFSAPLAGYFRTTVVYSSLTENLNEKIGAYVNDTMNEAKLSELIEAEPDGVISILEGFGTDLDAVRNEYKNLITSGEENIAAKISDYIVIPAAETISSALAILVVFVVSVLLLNLVLYLLDLIFKLPILNFANKLGGFVVGAALALLVSFVFCTVVEIALPYLPGTGINIDSETAANTMLYSKISEINPLAFLYK